MNTSETKNCPDCGKPMEVKEETLGGNVHEVWGSKSSAWNAAKLPSYGFTTDLAQFNVGDKSFGPFKKGDFVPDDLPQETRVNFESKGVVESLYHYVHRKSSLRIWINAARNLYIGGGGDAVSDLNPMWTELRAITKEMGMDTWHSFEKFIMDKESVINPSLLDWIRRGLTFSASDYGTETRECCKAIIWYRRDLLKDPVIAEGIKNPPKLTEKERVQTVVRKTFFQVLNRHPDKAGLDNYTAQILAGALKEDRLPKVLMESDEYLRDHPPPQSPSETVPLNMPFKLEIQVSEETMAAQMMNTRLYTEKWKPRLDLGFFIEDHVSKEFWVPFYELLAKEGPEVDFEEFVQMLSAYSKLKVLTS